MTNPDPKKYILRKLRGQDKYVLVDKAILRWRKFRKKKRPTVFGSQELEKEILPEEMKFFE